MVVNVSLHYLPVLYNILCRYFFVLWYGLVWSLKRITVFCSAMSNPFSVFIKVLSTHDSLCISFSVLELLSELSDLRKADGCFNGVGQVLLQWVSGLGACPAGFCIQPHICFLSLKSCQERTPTTALILLGQSTRWKLWNKKNQCKISCRWVMHRNLCTFLRKSLSIYNVCKSCVNWEKSE